MVQSIGSPGGKSTSDDAKMEEYLAGLAMKFAHTVDAYIVGGKHDDIRGTLLTLSLLHVDAETGKETAYVGGKLGNVALQAGDLVLLAESRKAAKVVSVKSPDYKNYKSLQVTIL